MENGKFSVFHTSRQFKRSRAENCQPGNSLFKGFLAQGFFFLQEIVRVKVGGKNHFYATKPISDNQSQFSMSKIIRIFLNFFFIEEYQFRGMFFVIDIF